MRNMSLAVKLFDVLEFLMETQFLVDCLLVEAGEHGCAQDSIKDEERAGECSNEAHASLQVRENSHNCE